MNEHAQKLQTILEKEFLTSKEVKKGVVTWFFAINRDFVKQRMRDACAGYLGHPLGCEG